MSDPSDPYENPYHERWDDPDDPEPYMPPTDAEWGLDNDAVDAMDARGEWLARRKFRMRAAKASEQRTPGGRQET
jgi:hypothetical protein